ncbi:type I polyketide synthase [Rhodoferax sp. U2-2l]|uniref:type I polyketide synthase n=1 Tax=Rhodoferax sp. U2-2l TaxID=2884000 RepID=UPI001D0A21FC|nr:type I polyketide synthase [Rhodoferax sp. U2-2l]MCB8747851.1 type I polyketide synthase [Rhodoferax sp. U2-2l]
MKKIAVVSCSFRFPGTTTDQYWPDLVNGKDLVTEVDPSRWAMETYRHPSKKHGGTSYTFASGTLGDVSGFDASFFGISPREAAQMDPQQRMLLEMTWEAFENAGIKPSSVKGSKCGVFIGISSVDYAMRFADDLGAVDSTVGTGNTSCIAANRISYLFDLKGPSMSIDTACSSSLVAFHQACQSIALGETTMALAGGVSLLLHPYGFITFSKASMLSRKGICNVFDAAADGYVRSEGGGIFVLKDYDQALADGDPILAVVAGTSVNSDGKKTGLTVPSAAAQSALLTEAYAKAGISPADISYLEAHGTGTPVGDPIEAKALAKALGFLRPTDHPLLIGSVKSNLGHMEAASGIAGLVKALHCIKHRVVPATIHFKTPNPNIPFEDWNLKVVSQTTALPATGRVVVGINGFGFGGTNAHVILESPAAKVSTLRPKRSKDLRPVRTPLFISGKSEAALKEAAKQYVTLLRKEDVVDLYDIAYNAAFHREWHEHRAVVFGDTPHAMASTLACFAQDKPAKLPVVTATGLSPAPKVAFIYSGNGSQWEGMGRRLLAESATFKAAVQAVERYFEKYEDFSLEEELKGSYGPGRYERTEIAQPALFAIQVGVTEMLRFQGVVPSAVSGHSVGEVAAAWACGALTLEQAVKVIYYRSHFQGLTKGQGQMTAVALGEAQMQSLLEEAKLTDRVTIAGINSARGVTLAGPSDSLTQLEVLLSERQFIYKRLDLDYAFHSEAMDPIQAELEQALRSLNPQKTQVDFVSTVTGGVVLGHQLDASYWWKNIRQPVLFEKAIGAIRAVGIDVFVEVGPHAVLRGYINECLKADAKPGRTLPTLLRQDDSSERVWEAASQVMLAGVDTDLKPFFPHPGRFTELPNYPWQRDRHWQTVTPESHHLLQRRKVNPLLGYPLRQQALAWENQIDPLKYPELADHVVSGSVVFPGAGYAELGLAAAAQWAAEKGVTEWLEIEELDIKMFMVLNADSTKLVRVSLEPSDGSFAITSRDQFSADAWTLHANGRVITEPTGLLLPQDKAHVPDRQPDFDAPSHALLTRQVGLNYGPAFQAIDVGWVERDTAWARLELAASPADTLTPSLLHPALLDCGFQLVFHLLRDHTAQPSGVAYLPTKIGRLSLRTGAGLPVIAKAQLLHLSPHSLSANFTLYDGAGAVAACLQQVRFRRVPMGHKASAPLSLLSYTAVPAAHPQTDIVVPPSLAGSLQSAVLSATTALDSDVASLVYAHEVEPLLAALCASYAVEAFLLLADPCRMLSEQSLARVLGNTPDAPAMLGRMITILEEDHLAERLPSGWQLRDTSGLLRSGDIWHALLADHPEHFAAIHAVSRVGMHLAALVKGQTTLAKLLPSDCTFAQMATASFGLSQSGQIAQAVVTTAQSCLSQLTEGQRFNVVEISSGPPVLAGQLMRHLPADRCQFTFITSNAETLDECQRHQERWSALALTHLSSDANSQGVAPNAHLVIVHNDFLSQQDALKALDVATQLLANQGVVLWLSAPPARWLDLLFGTQSALHLSPQQWQQQLEQRGVTVNPCLLLSPDSPSSPYALVGQGPLRAATPAAEVTGSGAWLVLADTSEPSQHWATALANALPPQSTLIGAPELDLLDVTAVGNLLSTLKTQHGKVCGVIHLYGFTAATSPLRPEDMLAHQLQRSAIATTLVQACEATQTSTTCWLVTAGAAARLLPNRRTASSQTNDAPLYGLGRTLLNEPGYLSVRLLDLEHQSDGGTFNPVVLQAMAQELMSPAQEREVILTATGERFAPRLRVAPRHLQTPSVELKPTTVQLSFATPGQLRHLRWEATASPDLQAYDVAIEVKATGLNFRDVMYALGMLSDEAVESGFAGPTLGLECAGVVTALGASVVGLTVGDRVLAFGASCFSNQVITRASAVAVLPRAISFEAAATIPTTFFTAYYALHHLARLRPGERVLIHGAAGGVGIAAIQLAKHLGAEVFATAGSDDKRDFLRLLGADHIFDSRSLAFADHIMAVTQGQGVDVVLNSLAGEAINRNLSILKPFGRFLELGKRDFYENTKVGLRPFRNNIAYFGIDADQLLQAQPALTESLFKDVLALFAQGVLHPLPFQTFEADDVVEAFRHMQQSRHIGKIVVTYRHGINHVHALQSVQIPLTLSEDATYLVTGGLGGFGLKTAQWLVGKGARHLVLISRSGPVSEESVSAIAALEAQGVKVLAQACDVTDLSRLAALFDQIATTMPPLRGLVHAAVVIDDALARNTTPAQLATIFAPKILGARHLHDLTQRLPLDFFVLYSSATTLFGNPGQGAYVAANAYLESLAAARRSAGLPALCVRWGAIDDVGFLARNQKIKDALQSRMGGKTIPSADALDLMEDLLVSNRSDLGAMELEWSALSRFLPSATEPKFADLAAFNTDVKSDEGQSDDIHRLLEELSPEELTLAVKDLLRAEVAEILRMAPEKIDPDRSVYELGLDSLMGVELILAIESRFGIQLSVMALSESPTISKLADKLISQLKPTASGEEDGAQPTSTAAQVQHVATQHGADVDSKTISLLVNEIEAGSTPGAAHAQRIIQ